MLAGPGLFENKLRQPAHTEEIRKPASVKIYQMPQTEEQPKGAGYMSHVLNNTVSQDVIDSLGGIQDTIRPMKLALKGHELRPYEF